ncbi:hypothetical protein RJ641_034194 [Dillenia turbinata]|uniref:Uncharacterized protein n=1 Tax=Dillenia turbinata TaxID=194707 RepID=A0AAN8VNP7_9MAGN
MTSSIATVVYSTRAKNPIVVVDETWFSDPEFYKQSELRDVLLKILDKEATWNFTTEKGIDMALINLAMIINVAEAHILAFKNPSASSRYCLAERVAYFANIVKILSELDPSFHLSDKLIQSSIGFVFMWYTILDHFIEDPPDANKPYGPDFQISKEKATSLGLNFIPLEVTLQETVESLKEKKFLQL